MTGPFDDLDIIEGQWAETNRPVASVTGAAMQIRPARNRPPRPRAASSRVTSLAGTGPPAEATWSRTRIARSTDCSTPVPLPLIPSAGSPGGGGETPLTDRAKESCDDDLHYREFRIRPEHADAWPRIADAFTAATRAEPGCLWFDWSRSLDDPAEYVLVEAFRDGDAGAAHVGSAHFAQARRELPQYLAETPRIISQTVDQDDWSELGELAVK